MGKWAHEYYYWMGYQCSCRILSTRHENAQQAVRGNRDGIHLPAPTKEQAHPEKQSTRMCTGRNQQATLHNPKRKHMGALIYTTRAQVHFSPAFTTCQKTSPGGRTKEVATIFTTVPPRNSADAEQALTPPSLHLSPTNKPCARPQT